MKRLYLFLANRNKQDVKLITILQGSEPVGSKVDDIFQLKLPQVWERRIAAIVHENRMHYNLMVESAITWDALRETLKERGYKNVPSGISPLLQMKAYVKAPVANTEACKSVKIMIQKG